MRAKTNAAHRIRQRAEGAIMRLKLAVILLLMSLASVTSAQESSAVDPVGLPPANGYSHVVIAPKGRLVVISGQVALNEKGYVVGTDDFEKQCVQVHENIKKALAAVGLTFNDVIRTDNYITDRKYLPLLRKVRTSYLPASRPPTSTLLIVQGLFRPELLIEVSVEAVIPDKP
jgi:enamine deaminase RidA (YjgF/YER057c/UK114 family)